MLSIKEIIKRQKDDPERIKDIKVKVDLIRIRLKDIEFPLEKIKTMSAGLDEYQLRMVGIYTYNISHKVKGEEPHKAYETKWVEHLGYRDCIDWIYRYCPQCNEVFFERGVLCDFDTNLAHSYEYPILTKNKKLLELYDSLKLDY